jgi:hypothetical protein
MGAFTMTDRRAAFTLIGAGPIVAVESSGGEASILLFEENPAPSVGEVKERHVQQEHGIVPARTSSSKQLARAAPRSGLIQFCFHFDICLPATLDMARPHHHGAVGGFFNAPQERVASTSFGGGDKSGALRQDC